jgi:mono/diheme cytochrome c family protein
VRLNTQTLLTLGLLSGLAAQAYATTGSAIETGRYLTAAAGCYACHTDTENDGEPFAGGHRLETEYGVFVVPNITPDADTGIGGWTDTEFIAAVKHGESPGGGYYYPAFPYASYAGATDADMLAIKAYLDSLPPVSNAVGEHELLWWIPPSGLMGIWQTLFAPALSLSIMSLPACRSKPAATERRILPRLLPASATGR